MNIQKLNVPAPLLVIEDLFSAAELDEIMVELDCLRRLNLFRPPLETGAALDTDGRPLKSNSGLFLDALYSFDRSASSILTHSRKIFRDEAILEAATSHQSWFFRDTYLETNSDDTLVSYYESNDYYSPHRDIAEFTTVIWLYREPKQFSGGDFMMPGYNFSLEAKHNAAIIFPSRLQHAVSKISMDEENTRKGLGRYAISVFAKAVYK